MPAQRSFSEQNHSAKSRHYQQSRPEWSRNKSFPTAQASKNETNSKPLQEKPPVPVSTATKNRLSNFRLAPEYKLETTKPVVNLISQDNKENTAGGDECTARSANNVEKKVEEQQALLDLPKKSVPSTPSARLALPDLIGMGDIKRAVHNISPDERIEWDYDKDNTDSSGNSFGGIRKAKKRARSSSPVSSPAAHATAHFSARDVLTPQLDPGSELWGRYSLSGSNVATPQGPTVPALAHLMCTSSPQPTKEGTTPRSISVFRRANSCGNQFPKRRRVGGTDDGDVFTESAQIGPSKLSVLIERVQEDLGRSGRPERPGKNFRHLNARGKQLSLDSEDSPPRHSSERSMNSPIGTGLNPFAPPRIPETTNTCCITKQATPSSNSSDYGDDFDDDEMDELLNGVVEKKPSEINDASLRPPISKPAPDPPPRPERIATKPSRPPAVKKCSNAPRLDDNEFGDFDRDLAASDLEQVLSQYDPKPQRGRPVKHLKDGAGPQCMPQRKPVAKSDSDDEFGDDGLDDFDFEAVEAEATQSVRSRHS
ncbi:hypothetical protein BGZ60DRAFT_59532 [Tricladium varicosporioides]|nr:hypothetical protein BGZ60DRAFT_59532 [Hymenoscyphus varicosporioides]